MRVVTTTDRRTVQHSSLTAAQRSQRARLAALSRHAKSDGAAATQAAREAFLARFDGAANPDAALRAHMQRLAFARGRATTR